MATTSTQRNHELPGWFVVLARCRGLAGPVGLVLMVAGVALAALAPSELVPSLVRLGVPISGAALVGAGMFVTVLPIDPAIRTATPRVLRPPVDGIWEGCNSPTDGVPSHGTHGFGQTYAIDLVPRGEAEGTGETPTRPEANFQRPETFPGFGRPIRSSCSGTVVAVHDRARDHRARQGRLGAAVLVVEGMLREFAGGRAMLGNHVSVAVPDDTDPDRTVYVVFAHLQRGSLRVRVGEDVQPGQVIGRCGNSGNSTEPHLHMQVMDHPRALVAAGLRFVFDEFHVDGEPRHQGLPATGERMYVPPASEST
ncbi:M23 family metallopeptidase [Lipingzhangella sp. LS1_29]|uniref:M23 family metallopeptidase n=1 Tax=Lipingzhangella rawalii TaxID=2055835 RepID=A0ABU2HBS5_9ACTN|nr:M23 family metallopeptidase [Lipingzhangella rawalii]MDS1272265.1 M23 family metallopeptidase [Lipingzhangella rawalii]